MLMGMSQVRGNGRTSGAISWSRGEKMACSEQGLVSSVAIETSSLVAAGWAEYLGPGAHS